MLHSLQNPRPSAPFKYYPPASPDVPRPDNGPTPPPGSGVPGRSGKPRRIFAGRRTGPRTHPGNPPPGPPSPSLLPLRCPSCASPNPIHRSSPSHTIVGTGIVTHAGRPLAFPVNPVVSVAPGIVCPLCAHHYAYIHGQYVVPGGRPCLKPLPPVPAKSTPPPDPIPLSPDRKPIGLSELPHHTLRSMATRLNLPNTGRTSELIARIEAHYASDPSGSSPDPSPSDPDE